MSATWNAAAVNVLWGTYRPPTASATIIEIPLLAGATLSNTASVIQQGGRRRKRISWQGYVTTWAGYTTLYDDHVAGTARTFTGPDAVSLSCHIERLSEPEYVQAGFIRYHITLVEA